MRKLSPLLFLAGLCGLFILLPKPVHAQTYNYAASITVDGSNDVLINGQATNQDYVASGDTVNVGFTNNAPSQILICTKDSAAQAIASGSSATVPIAVSAEDEMVVDLSGGNCANGAGTPGSLYFVGATGNLSCSLSGKVWNVTGTYSYVPQTIDLYRGGTYVADIQASSGSAISFNTSVNEEFSGQTTASTYYLYDGTSSSDELIGQATCPAVAAAQTTTTTPISTPATVATTPTTTTPTPTAAATTTPSTTATSTLATPLAKQPARTTPKKISGSNTGLYLSSSLIVLLVVVLVVLNLTHIWTKPGQLLLKGWNKVNSFKPKRG